MGTAVLDLMDNQSDQLVIPGAGAVLDRGELDVQIVTAHRFPRSIARFKEQALAMATLDEETASGCFYSVPRGGKAIVGPSVRLAEIVLSSWGNVRSDSRIVEEGDKQITAEGCCWDLERNVAVRVQVRRRITDKNGRRFNDDMITVTGNAAMAIARRNAVFNVIPMAFTRAVFLAAKDVAIGNAETLSDKRASMVAYFGKMGVTKDRVGAAVGKPSIDDITLDDLAVLKGFATALRDGDTTIEEVFPEPEKPKSLKELAPKPNGKAKDLPKPEAKPVEAAKPEASEGELVDPDTLEEIEQACKELHFNGARLESHLRATYGVGTTSALKHDQGIDFREHCQHMLETEPND